MEPLRVVGKREIRQDALCKVTGEAKFTADYLAGRRDVLIAKALYSPYSHALIQSIDTTEAEKLPGVVKVITAKDLPGRNGYGLMQFDKPVLAEKEILYAGDAVAAVAAVDLKTAETAISLIKVTYEPLQGYDDIRELTGEAAPKLHTTTETPNISSTYTLVHGDAEEAFQHADIILEDEFETPMVDHAYLEPDVCLSELDPMTGGIIIYCPHHSVHLSRRTMAGVFNLPQSKIRVISPYVGGGFGGKEDSCFDVESICGVLTLLTRRPVYFELTREEVFQETCKRHASKTKYRLAADRDGNILGVQADILVDKGAYVGIDIINLRMVTYCAGPYRCPNAKAVAHSVFTNRCYTSAMRGFGVPQIAFAVESTMDDLARRVGKDPFALRLQNMLQDGDLTAFGARARKERGLGLGECLKKVREKMDWDTPLKQSNDPFIRRGRGIAAYMYGTGGGSKGEGAMVSAQLQPDGSLNLDVSINELGQGVIQAMAQIGAETMGITSDLVSLNLSDSASSPDAGFTTASRATTFAGNAVIDACSQIKNNLKAVAARHLSVDEECLVFAENLVYPENQAQQAIPLSQVVGWARTDGVCTAATGSWYAPMSSMNQDIQGEQMHAFSYGVAGVEISVDLRDGSISVDRAVQAIDVGRAINPLQVEAQMDGGGAMGIGYGLMEELFTEQGKITNASFHGYLIPTALDLPDFEEIIVECPNELGPYGAKGVGEPPLIGYAPAIRNAFADATGVRINTIPLTPVRVMEALKKAGKLPNTI